MIRSRVQMAAWGVLAVSALLALPGLVSQQRQSSELRRRLGDRDAAERARVLDNPAFAAAHEIASVVPPDACVLVLAYAGPDAITYYQARLNYLLYPRRVHLVADSAAERVGCGFLAVLHDTAANLAASPFAGAWDETALSVRTASLPLALEGDAVEVFAAP